MRPFSSVSVYVHFSSFQPSWTCLRVVNNPFDLTKFNVSWSCVVIVMILQESLCDFDAIPKNNHEECSLKLNWQWHWLWCMSSVKTNQCASFCLREFTTHFWMETHNYFYLTKFTVISLNLREGFLWNFEGIKWNHFKATTLQVWSISMTNSGWFWFC